MVKVFFGFQASAFRVFKRENSMSSQDFSEALCFSYGQASFCRDGNACHQGQVILSAHKLYLKGDKGDIPDTFIPLEKIYRIRILLGTLTVYVRPSTFMQFTAQFKGSIRHMRLLKKDLVDRRQLRKRKFGLEFFDPEEDVG